MSRPLGSNFKVPHGFSNAMLLPTITEFSIDYAKSRYADCSRAGNFALPDDDDGIACEKLIKGLKKDRVCSTTTPVGLKSVKAIFRIQRVLVRLMID